MSASTSRPHIQSVSGAALGAIAAGGAVMAAALIASVINSLGSAGQKAYERSAKQLKPDALGGLKPSLALRNQEKAFRAQARAAVKQNALPEIEAAKISALASIASTPYQVENSGSVRQQLSTLCGAASLSAVQQADNALLKTIESEHQRLFVQALSLACSNAAVKVGFKTIQMASGPLGEVRIVASDSVGRTLVTEIQSVPDRDTSMVTEVVGVADGSCNEILDAFDKALDEEGVRASKPRRKFTGGVCELAAARDFILSKVKPDATTNPEHATKSSYDAAARRSQRLNQQARQKLR